MTMARWHDALGRLVRTEDALGGTVRYWYDGAGNPVAAQGAEGHVTRAGYNDLGHRLNRTDPDAGFASFTYDGFGQVLTQTDARNVMTTHVYDALGRLTQRTSTNPAGAGLPVVWQESYAYESTTKRLSSQTTTMEGESPWATGYAYDPATGREDTVTYASRLSNATTNETWWTANNQDAWGALTSETFGNGVIGTHATFAQASI